MSKKKKQLYDRLAEPALHSWQEKINALNDLESRLQAEIVTYIEKYNVNVLDIMVLNPASGEIYIETDL